MSWYTRDYGIGEYMSSTELTAGRLLGELGERDTQTETFLINNYHKHLFRVCAGGFLAFALIFPFCRMTPQSPLAKSPQMKAASLAVICSGFVIASITCIWLSNLHQRNAVTIDKDGVWYACLSKKKLIPFSAISEMRVRNSQYRIDLIDQNGELLMYLDVHLLGLQRLIDQIWERVPIGARMTAAGKEVSRKQ